MLSAKEQCFLIERSMYAVSACMFCVFEVWLLLGLRKQLTIQHEEGAPVLEKIQDEHVQNRIHHKWSHEELADNYLIGNCGDQ